MAKKDKKALSDAEKSLESFYSQNESTDKSFATKGRKGLIVGICCGILALCLCLTAGFLYLSGIVGNRHLNDSVVIAGVDVSGMGREEAIQAVSAVVGDSYETETMVVKVDGFEIKLSPVLTGAKLDVQGAVNGAFLKNFKGGVFPLSPYLNLDKKAIYGELESIADHFQTEFTESSYTIKGSRPALTEEAVNEPAQTLEIYTGTPQYQFDADAIYSAIVDSYNNHAFSTDYKVPGKFPEKIDLNAIHKDAYIAPIEAEMDRETFDVTDHSYGYGLDLEECQKVLDETPYGENITLHFTRIAPKETKQSLSSVLFRDVLGSYSAYSSSSYNRDINLKLSCQAINGIVIYPGEVFGYNRTLGERTPEKGYKPAAGYWGSEIIMSYGGGICQASSSLYYCALIADLEIVERHNHGYVSSYMPYGMDATVDWAGPDLKIKNTTEYPIKIEAYSSAGNVFVKLLGTDTKDHYVKMEYEILEVDNYKTVYEEMYEDNEKGYRDGEVINSPYTGYTVRTFRCRYNKETDELISRELEVRSRYSKRDKTICKIIPKPVETPPATTTPPVTTQPPTETTTPTTTPTESTGISGNGGVESDE